MLETETETLETAARELNNALVGAIDARTSDLRVKIKSICANDVLTGRSFF
jgi:hypothetical protein